MSKPRQSPAPQRHGQAQRRSGTEKSSAAAVWVGLAHAARAAQHCKRRCRRRIQSISHPLPYPDNLFEDPRELSSPTQTMVSMLRGC